MFCPQCSVVFDKKETNRLENSNTQHMNKVGRRDQQQGFFKREGPQKAHSPKTYVSRSNAPVREWSGPTGKTIIEKGKWKKI